MSPCLLQLPRPRLMHLVLSPGIQPAPTEWLYWTCTCSLLTHLAHKKQAQGIAPTASRVQAQPKQAVLPAGLPAGFQPPLPLLRAHTPTPDPPFSGGSSLQSCTISNCQKEISTISVHPEASLWRPRVPMPGETVGTHMNKATLSKEPSSPGACDHACGTFLSPSGCCVSVHEAAPCHPPQALLLVLH